MWSSYAVLAVILFACNIQMGTAKVLSKAKEEENTRTARDLRGVNLTGLPFCKNNPVPTQSPDGSIPCHPHDLLVELKVREKHSTLWKVCRFSVGRKQIMCEDFEQYINDVICYRLRCP